MSSKSSSKRSLLGRLLRLGGWLIGIVLLIGLGVFLAQSGLLPGIGGTTSGGITGGAAQPGAFSPADSAQTSMAETTVALRPATEGIGLVSAAGNLELAREHQVVVEVNGTVSEILVDVGDVVTTGDVLARLDSREAVQAVQQSLLNLASAQADLNELLTGASASELAGAEASLRSAQAKLADVMAGPTAQEIAAARASLAAAQANYSDVVAPPTGDELTQLEADLRRAEVAVAEAQTAYDHIAWQNSSGMTSEAAELQSATIDYESAKAAYNEATAPASNGDVQSAISSVQSAQQTLDDLLDQPTEADIAAAEADVASAEQTLQDLLDGEGANTLESARVALAQAQLDVEAAADDLAATELHAPIDGTILSMDLEIGQQASSGTVAVTLADTQNLQLTVNVAETDIKQLSVGMPAAITIDALPEEAFSGEVLRIAPSSDPEQSVVNYPVTIQLTDDDLAGVRAGMTAVAEMRSASLAGAWLAPRTALQTNEGGSQLIVIRNGQPVTVPVTVGQIQGEWIIVESPELQAGDEVAASLATYTDDNLNRGFGPPGGGQRPGN